MLAAPDTSAELVELCQAETLCAFYHHDARVGDVYADFDDGGRDENVNASFTEALHNVFFFFRLHLAVEHFYCEIGKNSFGKLFIFFLYRFYFEFLEGIP